MAMTQPVGADDAAAPLSRRERKRRKTRRELIEAATALIAERGVSGLRVSDVTERTDVALGSFYSHFETKDDIVGAVVSETVRSLADAIGGLVGQLADPAEAMSVGVRKLIDLARREPALAQLLVRLGDGEIRFEEVIWSSAHVILMRGVASGRFRIASPDLILAIASAGVFTTLRVMVEDGFDEARAQDAAISLLRLVGIDHDEAVRITSLDLPALAD